MRVFMRAARRPSRGRASYKRPTPRSSSLLASAQFRVLISSWYCRRPAAFSRGASGAGRIVS
ncbi:hypothetical protein CHLRE_04g223876v5 [Chlamydomonas reinhardtii]|uniref:Uncharacterized protein n=1 Tax=Chlamydomonas reinhardtii TaxID=3055 RepID=A0A2K3DUF2_CHLRE|nr:uncharacterized protein CHLRE_04g223876v5 [Chlamydomonas reinhardtii]PNW84167.1 hypothetical protein CHLRE_04g223876v5 [Chlamydomonas reinhardtii]